LNDFFNQIRIVLFEKPFDFSGRSPRKEYWSFWLFTQLTFLPLLFLSLRARPLAIFLIIYYLILLIPTLAVTVRRLHDVNKSAFWLIGFAPFALLAYSSLLFLSLIAPDNQTAVQMDILQIFLYSIFIFAIFALTLWWCFPIFMFLVEEGNKEENRYGPNK
tara:strand:+ start:739 stop:1221 length:483 start_codon:yes stop_codon:yes gene_type:complete